MIHSHLRALWGVCVALILSFSLVSCGGGGGSTQAQDSSSSSTSSSSSSSSVTILQESDVPDFEKYYKPGEFSGMDLLRSDSKWSFVRSAQSEHFIVFWEAGFGLDPNANSVPQALRVDVQGLLANAESVFQMNVNTLKFADLGVGKSQLDHYKIEIYLFYQTDWLAVGSGYDNVIGALWVNPSASNGGQVLAHEIGHSFQYQVYADLLASGATANNSSRGFRYGFGGLGGNAFWELSAQWQSLQSFPNQIFTNFDFVVYRDNYNRHVFHEWQRYASYFLPFYWAEKRGIDVVGKLWRESHSPEDPIQAYMRLYTVTDTELFDEIYQASTRFVTWDLDALRELGANYIGNQRYGLLPLADGGYQVSYAKCPGTTGYNVIPLNVPAAGTVVTASFAGLAPGSNLASGDPGWYSDSGVSKQTTHYNNPAAGEAGWRYGYVALLANGNRIYGAMNQMPSADVAFTVPEGTVNLWFVVLGAPATYKAHPWDEIESNDAQWPYQVKFTNTNLLGSITLDPNAAPKDLTLSYNLAFPADSQNYSGTSVDLFANSDINKLAEALVMQPSAISNAMLSPGQTPTEGKIALAAIEPGGGENYTTTANGLGFWFDRQGAVTNWGAANDSVVFSEFSPSELKFTFGQYPGKLQAGETLTLKEVMVYTKSSSEYRVTFEFNIAIQ